MNALLTEERTMLPVKLTAVSINAIALLTILTQTSLPANKVLREMLFCMNSRKASLKEFMPAMNRKMIVAISMPPNLPFTAAESSAGIMAARDTVHTNKTIM